MPSGPSHSNHGDPASSSKSAAISKRPVTPGPGAAQLDVATEPRREHARIRRDGAVGELDLDAERRSAAPTRRALANSSSGTRRAVRAKPVPRSTSAHCRSPAIPRSPIEATSSSSPCIDLTGYRQRLTTRIA